METEKSDSNGQIGRERPQNSPQTGSARTTSQTEHSPTPPPNIAQVQSPKRSYASAASTAQRETQENERKTTQTNPPSANEPAPPQEQAQPNNEANNAIHNIADWFQNIANTSLSGVDPRAYNEGTNDEGDLGSKESPTTVYGCLWKTVTSSGGNQQGPRTRNSTKNSNNGQTVTSYFVVQSPDGPFLHVVKNIGKFQCDKNPDNSPYKLFKVDTKYVDVTSKVKTIQGEFIHFLNGNDLSSMPTSQLRLLPRCTGKIVKQKDGSVFVQPFELTKPRQNDDIGKWIRVKGVPLLQILNPDFLGHPTNFNHSTEISFTIACDHQGVPFATLAVDCNMIGPEGLDTDACQRLQPYTFIDSLADTKIDSRSTIGAYRLSSFHSPAAHTAISQILSRCGKNPKYLNFVPSLFHSDFLNNHKINGDDMTKTPHDPDAIKRILADITTISLADIITLSRPNYKANALTVDEIHLRWYNALSTAQKTLLIQEGFLDADGASANWVFHHLDSSATQLITNTVHNSMLKGNNQLAANVIAIAVKTNNNKHAKLGSQIDCPFISESWFHGYGTPLLSQICSTNPYTGLTNISCTSTTTTVDTLFHLFKTDGDKKPLLQIQLDSVTRAQFPGKLKRFQVLFDPTNNEAKKVIRNLGSDKLELIPNSPKKHAKIDFPNGYEDVLTQPNKDDKKEGKKDDKKIDYDNLYYNRFRVCTVTILSGAIDTIAHMLGQHCHFQNLGNNFTDSNSFELWSKHFVPFPSELASLRKNFKMVEIMGRGHFRVILYDWQTMKDAYKHLHLSKPSELDSLCLTAAHNCPWLQISDGNMHIQINAPYEEAAPKSKNTLYIDGITTIGNAEFIEEFLAYFLQTKVEIVDTPEETTQPNTCTARFLHASATTSSKAGTVLAVTTLNNDTFTELTSANATFRLSCLSNKRYSFTSNNLNRLTLISAVQSTTAERNEDAAAEKFHAESQVTGEQEEEWQTTPTRKGSKRTTPPAGATTTTSNKQARGTSPTSQADDFREEIDANLPGRRPTNRTENDDKKETTASTRKADTNDFDQSNCERVRTWVEKKITNNSQVKAFSSSQLHTLRVLIARHISTSSPNYHNSTGTALPTHWDQKSKGATGIGRLLVLYLTGNSQTKTPPGEPLVAIEILTAALKATDRIGNARRTFQQAISQASQKTKTTTQKPISVSFKALSPGSTSRRSSRLATTSAKGNVNGDVIDLASSDPTQGDRTTTTTTTTAATTTTTTTPTTTTTTPTDTTMSNTTATTSTTTTTTTTSTSSSTASPTAASSASPSPPTAPPLLPSLVPPLPSNPTFSRTPSPKSARSNSPNPSPMLTHPSTPEAGTPTPRSPPTSARRLDTSPDKSASKRQKRDLASNSSIFGRATAGIQRFLVSRTSPQKPTKQPEEQQQLEEKKEADEEMEQQELTAAPPPAMDMSDEREEL